MPRYINVYTSHATKETTADDQLISRCLPIITNVHGFSLFSSPVMPPSTSKTTSRATKLEDICKVEEVEVEEEEEEERPSMSSIATNSSSSQPARRLIKADFELFKVRTATINLNSVSQFSHVNYNLLTFWKSKQQQKIMKTALRRSGVLPNGFLTKVCFSSTSSVVSFCETQKPDSVWQSRNDLSLKRREKGLQAHSSCLVWFRLMIAFPMS